MSFITPLQLKTVMQSVRDCIPANGSGSQDGASVYRGALTYYDLVKDRAFEVFTDRLPGIYSIDFTKEDIRNIFGTAEDVGVDEATYEKMVEMYSAEKSAILINMQCYGPCFIHFVIGSFILQEGQIQPGPFSGGEVSVMCRMFSMPYSIELEGQIESDPGSVEEWSAQSIFSNGKLSLGSGSGASSEELSKLQETVTDLKTKVTALERKTVICTKSEYNSLGKSSDTLYIIKN